jgi:membrane dipeptidase
MRFLQLSAWALIMALSTLGRADEPKKSEEKPMQGEVKLTDEALKIHHGGLLIDGHNDLPWQFREKKDRSFNRLDISKPQPSLHTDIPRLRKGGLGAQFWSAYVPAESGKKHTAVTETLEQIDIIERMIKRYPDTFEQGYTADDIERIHKEGKIASLIGIEGGHSIDNSLGVLRMLYALGARYMTLTHSENTDWADSATDDPKNHGLSPFGEQVVLEMNRLGMLVDISHVSAETMRHVLRVSRAPVIASHSSAYALAQTPRNVPDDVLSEIRRKDGVVMVNFFSGFIVPEAARLSMDMFHMGKELRKQYPKEEDFLMAIKAWHREHPIPRGSIRNVVDHIDHIAKVAGVEHVGIGSDFDGVPTLPRQLDDVSYYPYITQELINRGYKTEDIYKIMGGNVLRVMRKVEAVAKNHESASQPQTGSGN